MKPLILVALTFGLALVPATGSAQDEAARAAIEGLIQSGALPAAEELVTLRRPESFSASLSDNTDRVLQRMGVELEAGRVTAYACEVVQLPEDARGGPGEARVCRHADDRSPIVILVVATSDAGGLVKIRTESVFDGPTRRCVGVGGAEYDVRVIRSAEGDWRFAEVTRTVESIGVRECWDGGQAPSPR